MKWFIVFLVFFPLLRTAAQTPAVPVWQREVASVLTSQVEAWNAGDIAGYMDGYWRSDSLLFTSGASIRRGWQETYDTYRKRYATKELMGRLLFSSLEYHLLSDSAAWVFGGWALERSGDRPNGVFTLVLRKIGGSWKVVHDHTSSSQ